MKVHVVNKCHRLSIGQVGTNRLIQPKADEIECALRAPLFQRSLKPKKLGSNQREAGAALLSCRYYCDVLIWWA